MSAALSIFVLLSLLVFVIRIASVALRLTGLEESRAKFQALSAFSGTGFTTPESETIVNYPVRRRIISLIMVIGNLGLVSVFATLVVSFVHIDSEVGAIVRQVAWLGSGLALLWFFILNKQVERIMCRVIGKALDATTSLGKRHFHRRVQIGDNDRVCGHPISDTWTEPAGSLDASDLEQLGLTVLAVRGTSGEVMHNLSSASELKPGDTLVLYGCESGHEVLEHMSRNSEANNNVNRSARLDDWISEEKGYVDTIGRN